MASEHDILCPTKEEALPCDMCAFIKEIRDYQDLSWKKRLIRVSQILMDANVLAYKVLYESQEL
jgi:hypothetical protein